MGQECSACTVKTGNIEVRERPFERAHTMNKVSLAMGKNHALEHDQVRRRQSIQMSTGMKNATYFDQDLDEIEEMEVSEDGVQGWRPLQTFSSGSTYHGQWLGNERHGYGVQRWPDGAYYMGQWHRNAARGKGHFVHADGDSYCGEWKYSVAHGLGTYRHVDPSGKVIEYAGHWDRDHQHGAGLEVWDGEQGCEYQGQFQNGHKEGYGRYLWPDNSEYLGGFHENSISGAGEYIAADERTFQGQWKRNKIHGIGRYEWPDGRLYDGEYVDDKKSGFGTYEAVNGQRYEGFWQNNKRHGLGIVFKDSASQNGFLGVWKDGSLKEEIREVVLDDDGHELNEQDDASSAED